MSLLRSLGEAFNEPHLYKGLYLTLIVNGCLQSSHLWLFVASSHCCRQLWWTYFSDPEQWHGDISLIKPLLGLSVQWQIRQEGTSSWLLRSIINNSGVVPSWVLQLMLILFFFLRYLRVRLHFYMIVAKSDISLRIEWGRVFDEW